MVDDGAHLTLRKTSSSRSGVGWGAGKTHGRQEDCPCDVFGQGDVASGCGICEDGRYGA